MEKYKLKKLVPKKKYYEVYMNADSNDGDYIATVSKLSQKEFDDCIEDLIALKNICNKSHELEDFCTDCWKLEVPSADYGQCHTLTDLKVRMFDIDGFVYDVKLNSK